MAELVSIIIPVYNGEKTILRAIESCCRQVYANIEILVIDNVSTDSTKAIVHQKVQSDQRVKLMVLGEKGRSKARNLGLDKANGQFIQFLDADDVLEKNKIFEAMNFFKHNADKIAYGTSIQYIKQKAVTKRTPDFKHKSEILIHNIFPINSFIFRKNAVRFDKNLEFDEDWLFWVDLLYGKETSVVLTNDIGGSVYVTGENTMKDVGKMLYYEIFVRGIIKVKYSNHNMRIILSDLKKMITLNLLWQRKLISQQQWYSAKKEFLFLNDLAAFILKVPIINKKMNQKLDMLLKHQAYQ